jgi:hypothetical protein
MKMSDLYDKAVLLKENIALKKKIAELKAQIERERKEFEAKIAMVFAPLSTHEFCPFCNGKIADVGGEE